jgi:hypothetical protein
MATKTPVRADAAEFAQLIGELETLLERTVAIPTRWHDEHGDSVLVDLDAERYLRLAEYAVAKAATTLTTRESTNASMFGFIYVALAILAPPGDGRYSLGDGDLALDAIALITEAAR